MLKALLAAVTGGALLWFLFRDENEDKQEEQEDVMVPVGPSYERFVLPRLMHMHRVYMEELKNQPNFNGFPKSLHYKFGLDTYSIDCTTCVVTKVSPSRLHNSVDGSLGNDPAFRELVEDSLQHMGTCVDVFQAEIPKSWLENTWMAE